VCLYDRANVGQSAFADGPLDGESSVADLHALLEAAGEEGPFVLLGSSFGGLIAYIYAVTHPEQVVGMVLLDPSLPDELARIADVVLPPEYRLRPNEWRSSAEQLDRLATFRQAEALIGREPPIPVTLLGTSELQIPSDLPVEEITDLTRRLQRDFVDRFGEGELVLVDAPHFMEPAIPDRIAAELDRLIARLPAGA
jgi:pimeloyl-ACP methyl ester carboxylesterase